MLCCVFQCEGSGLLKISGLIISFGLILPADKIPVYVNMSQKNDRNASDHIFIKDLPIAFTAWIHDPSHFLSHRNISYYWEFGDGSGLFVSNNSVLMHTYKLLGNFSMNLLVEAIIPTPCGPVTLPPSPPLPTHPGKCLWSNANREK